MTFKLLSANGTLQGEVLGGAAMRRWVAVRKIEEVRLYKLDDARGGLKLVCAGGETIIGEYASFNVLGAQVRLWRNLRNARLYIDDKSEGLVRARNPVLPKYPKLSPKRSA